MVLGLQWFGKSIILQLIGEYEGNNVARGVSRNMAFRFFNKHKVELLPAHPGGRTNSLLPK